MAAKRQYKLSSYEDRKGEDVWRIFVGRKENGSADYFENKKKEVVEKEADRLRELQKNNDLLGQEARDIVFDKRHDLVACVDDLKAVGATVRDAATFYLKFHSGSSRITAKKAVEEFNKHNSKRVRPGTRSNYERKAKHFSADFCDQSVNTITKAELNKWIDEKTVSGTSRYATIRGWVSWMHLFFNFLQKQNYLPQDLPNEASKIPQPRKVESTPRLAPWSEASTMLLWYDELANKREGKKGDAIARRIRGLMVYLVLVLFCGIRRDEACQVTWDDIDFGGRKIKVLEEGAKRKKRRVNNAEENVWAWLSYLKKHNAELPSFDSNSDGDNSNERRLVYRQREYRESFSKRGAKVPEIVATIDTATMHGKSEPKAKNQNIMRHSFISYHMKLYNSAGKTSRVAGNSEREVEGTYLELVTNLVDAEMWFDIRPPEVVTTEQAIETIEVDIEDAYQAEIQVKLLKGSIAENQKAAKAFVHYQSIVENFERQEPKNIHLLAEKFQWGDHDSSVEVKAGVTFKHVELEPWTKEEKEKRDKWLAVSEALDRANEASALAAAKAALEGATPEDIEAAAAAKTVAETAAAELVALEGDLEAEQVAMGQK
jgi:integrase